MTLNRDLTLLLTAYFSDQDVEEGAAELAFAGSNDRAYHEHVLSVLTDASAAAGGGDQRVVDTINHSHSAVAHDAAAAQVLIDDILTAYRLAHREITADDHHSGQ